LEQLCRAYWYPLYAFVRRQGYHPEDAQDLTQEFFTRLIEKDFLRHLRHQEGRFRSFLLKFVQHFLSDARDKARAQKRGGGQIPVSLNDLAPEERYALEPADTLTPELTFERCWAQTLFQRAQGRLRDEYVMNGKTALFDLLKDYDPNAPTAFTCAQLAEVAGMSESAVKVALHRLRQRHQALLRAEIAQTVSTPLEFEDEVRHLIAVAGR
jgi:RNA polymerase sigma-70 factor (ECF subfamily)